MTKVQMPVKCPKCKSTDVREVSERVFQQLHYVYVGSDAIKYELKYDDSENFGESYLQCDHCEYVYEQEIYDVWLEYIYNALK